MSLPLLLQQCPAYLVRLIWIVFVMGGRWPYSCCFVGCCFQDLFNIARSIDNNRQIFGPSQRTKKKLWNMRVTMVSIVIGAFGIVPKKTGKNDRRNWKSEEESRSLLRSRRLAFSQTLVKDYQLTLSHANNTNSPGSLLLSIPIGHHPWQILKTASSVRTELTNVSLGWCVHK